VTAAFRTSGVDNVRLLLLSAALPDPAQFQRPAAGL